MENAWGLREPPEDGFVFSDNRCVLFLLVWGDDIHAPRDDSSAEPPLAVCVTTSALPEVALACPYRLSVLLVT